MTGFAAAMSLTNIGCVTRIYERGRVPSDPDSVRVRDVFGTTFEDLEERLDVPLPR